MLAVKLVILISAVAGFPVRSSEIRTNAQNVTFNETQEGQQSCSVTLQDVRLTGDQSSEVKCSCQVIKRGLQINSTCEVCLSPCKRDATTVPSVTTSTAPGGSSETSTKLNVTSHLITNTDDDNNNNNNNNTKDNEGQNTMQELLKYFIEMKSIVAFPAGVVTGMMLSALIACLAVTCQRRKKKRSRNLTQSLEMVTSQAAAKVEDDGIQDQEAAEGGVESDELLAPDGDAAPKEAEYSDIDFSAMRRKNPAEEGETQETTETEYAEIKREDTEERRASEGEGGAVSVGNDETEATAEVGEAVSQNDSVPPEEAYSNVKEIMDET